MALVKYTVVCQGNAAEVLCKAREALVAGLNVVTQAGQSAHDPRGVLPSWFVERSSTQRRMSDEESRRWVERWKKLSWRRKRKEMAALEGLPWTTEGWLESLESTDRAWYWWDAQVDGPDAITVFLLITEWPFAPAAFKWLCRAAGAARIEEDLEDFLR